MSDGWVFLILGAAAFVLVLSFLRDDRPQ